MNFKSFLLSENNFPENGINISKIIEKLEKICYNNVTVRYSRTEL